MANCIKCGGEAHHSYGFDESLGLQSIDSKRTDYWNGNSQTAFTSTYRVRRHEGCICSQCIADSCTFSGLIIGSRRFCIGCFIACAVCALIGFSIWSDGWIFVLIALGLLAGAINNAYFLIRANFAIKHNKSIRFNDGAKVLLEYEKEAGQKIDTYFLSKKNKWPKW